MRSISAVSLLRNKNSEVTLLTSGNYRMKCWIPVNMQEMLASKCLSNKFSSQRLICIKECRSKCSQIAENQDELVDCLHDMEVMEEQLQEYSNINTTLQNSIEEMTPTMMIGK